MPKYFCTTKTPGSITYKNSIDSGCFSKDRTSFFGEHITDIYITETGTTELENLSHNIIDLFIIET